MTRAAALLALAVGAVWMASPRYAAAMTSVADQDTSYAPNILDANIEIFYPDKISLDDVPVPYIVNWFNDTSSYDPTDYWDIEPTETFYMPPNPASDLIAFLYMIRSSEHLFPRNVKNDDAYHIFYSGNSDFNAPELVNQRFYDMSDHPVITGECRAVPLPAAMCRAAGLNPGCVSTAAGAYQIIRPTWDRYRSQSPRIAAFDKAGQDECARRILHATGALDALYAGDFQGALLKASREWASLPGSTAQQNPKKMAFVTVRFNEGLLLA